MVAHGYGHTSDCALGLHYRPIRQYVLIITINGHNLQINIFHSTKGSEHHFSIYVIEVNDTTTATKYQKCASFRGIFSSQAIVLSCGNLKGITGSVLHIEDNSQHLDHFGLCEVEVFVRKGISKSEMYDNLTFICNLTIC